jgi:hypothetical protein
MITISREHLKRLPWCKNYLKYTFRTEKCLTALDIYRAHDLDDWDRLSLLILLLMNGDDTAAKVEWERRTEISWKRTMKTHRKLGGVKACEAATREQINEVYKLINSTEQSNPNARCGKCGNWKVTQYRFSKRGYRWCPMRCEWMYGSGGKGCQDFYEKTNGTEAI